MSDKTFEGQVKNVADGNIFDITITSVDSVPCIDPYCDEIIAAEKSELRDGMCSACYQNDVRQDSHEAGIQIFKVGFYTFLALVGVFILRLGYWAINVFVWDKPLTQPNLNQEILLGFPILFCSTWLAIRRAKKVELQRNLYIREKNNTSATKQ